MAILHLQMEEAGVVPTQVPAVLFIQGVQEELAAMQVEVQAPLVEVAIQLAPVAEVVRLVLVGRLLLPRSTEETVVQVQIHQ